MASSLTSREFYEQLFNNGAEIFERNLKDQGSPQPAEDLSDDGYCPECKGSIVYHFGIPVCSVCGLEPQNTVIGRKKLLIEMTPTERADLQIYLRQRETDIRTNL